VRSAADLDWAIARAAEVPPDDDWLGPRERAVLAGLRLAARRESWRLGRFAARKLLGEVEVLPDPDGAPRAFRRGGAALPGCLSLSHRDGVGLAAWSAAAIGCDVERIEPRSPAFVADYLTPAEQAFVAAAAEPALAPNLLWSAKESALKALRVGLTRDTRELEVSVDGEALAVRDLARGVVLAGSWRREGEHVLTFVRG
jgi:4'-phosphopantetheinyl transferase